MTTKSEIKARPLLSQKKVHFNLSALVFTSTIGKEGKVEELCYRSHSWKKKAERCRHSREVFAVRRDSLDKCCAALTLEAFPK